MLLSISGFSRELETEADNLGFERMKNAGYDVSGSANTFELFARESKALEYKRPFMFSSHPKMIERAKNFRALSEKDSGNGEVNRDVYLAKTIDARMSMLEEVHEQKNYKLMIFLLETEGKLDNFPPRARFFLADAFRMRGEDDDWERAEQEFRHTLETAPNFPATYSGLGTLLMRLKRGAEAIPFMRQYLELEPEGVDAGYIKRYLTKLEGESL